MHGDHIAAVAKDGDDEVDVGTVAATYIDPPRPSVRAMMKLL